MSTQTNPRIQPLDPATTTGPAREIFDGVKAKIGMVPNLYRVMGHSPAALAAALTFSNCMNDLARTPLDFPPAPDLPHEG